MCLSIFLAQVIGCYLFLVSLAMLIQQHRFKKTMTEFLGSAPLLTFSGFISLVIGLLIVIRHNIWVSEWPVLITLVGWITLLQGLMRIFFPDAFVKMMKDLMAKTGYTLMCWIWLLVGVYLIWAGFTQNYCG